MNILPKRQSDNQKQINLLTPIALLRKQPSKDKYHESFLPRECEARNLYETGKVRITQRLKEEPNYV